MKKICKYKNNIIDIQKELAQIRQSQNIENSFVNSHPLSLQAEAQEKVMERSKNYLLDWNLVLILSDKLKEIIQVQKNTNKLLNSPLFFNHKVIKNQMKMFRIRGNHTNLKKNLVSQISREIKINMRKHLNLDKIEDEVLLNLINDFIYIETLRLFRGLKLSLLSRFTSKKVLDEHIQVFK
jgi:hypothetical protein